MIQINITCNTRLIAFPSGVYYLLYKTLWGYALICQFARILQAARQLNTAIPQDCGDFIKKDIFNFEERLL